MRRHTALASLLPALLAGTVHAQGTDAPLAGPAVKSREVPGVQARYTAGDVGRFAGREREVPVPVFLEALRELSERDEPLTPAQTEKIREELGLFRAELAAFLGAHADEVRGLVTRLPASQRGRVLGETRELQRLGEMLDRVGRGRGLDGPERPAGRGRPERAGPGDGDERPGFHLRFRERPGDLAGAEPGAMGEPMTDETGRDAPSDEGGSEAADRLRELRSVAPSPGALETRLWALLTEGQRGVVGESLDRFLAERREGAERQRLDRDVERRRAGAVERGAEDTGADAARRPPQRFADLDGETRGRLLAELDAGTIPDGLWDRLPERARDRLSSLPEGRRAAALARLLRSTPDRRGDR